MEAGRSMTNQVEKGVGERRILQRKPLSGVATVPECRHEEDI